MSYDLAVWEGAQPSNDGEGGDVYDQLYDEYMEGEDLPPTPGIRAYAEALAERWAVLTEGATLGWGLLLDDASGPMIYLTMPYGLAGELSAEAARLAAELGFVCYDPQTAHLWPAHID
ncbi:hypothetical protein [Micromonospora sp. RP3T]|uniref:hypothetical protein n=1 Tax=Micromonospora sp. RP3T TaxID=2135446 RepID=UPI000D17C23C|nr:hypothetical protein [Micromonospora sp. RP3T]PTA43308.1 hypothetical protein C8054_26425 [Micromonospora sp. RP3T]